MQTAKIVAASTRIFVESPYNTELVSDIKEIPGRKWHPVEKCWSVPAEAEQSIRKVVRKYFLIEGEKAEYEILRLRVTGKSSAKRSYCGSVEIDGHEIVSSMYGNLRTSPNFEILKQEGGFVYGDGYINPRKGGHAFAVEYVVEIKVRKGAKIEATGHADYWGSFEVLGRIEEKSAEDQGSSSAAKPSKIRKAKALSPNLAALQLSEGFTVRKVGGVLKVASAKTKYKLAKAA